MVSYAMITSEDVSSPVGAPGVFLLSELHPFDRMKVVLEQAIYLDYLQKCSVTTTLKDFKQNVQSMFGTLPDKMYDNDDVIRETLYSTGYDAIRTLLYGDPAKLLLNGKINAHDIYNIFRQNNATAYYGNRYTATMTKTFMDQWIASTCGWYNAEEFPDGITHNCALFRPEVTTCSIKENINAQISEDVCITLTPVVMSSFDLKNAQSKNRNCLSCYLSNFNMKTFSLDDVLGLYASFAIDHDKYVMTNSSDSVKITMADVCFDMITGSSYVSIYTPTGKARIVDLEYWMKFVKSLIDANHMQPAQDNKLFGELLNKIGESENIVNFFTKDIDHITAQEALEFRNSKYVSLIQKHAFASMEDDNEENEDENDESASDNVEDDTSDENQDTDDTTEDTGGDATGDLGGTDEMDNMSAGEDEKDQPTKKVKPQIDPNKMLLEISNPQNEVMSDYLYREIVSQRIAALIKNPPKNAHPNDIIMLKRWRSRWLYLASVACLRDFLTRISLRLSN
jgi:hypothetical protein